MKILFAILSFLSISVSAFADNSRACSDRFTVAVLSSSIQTGRIGVQEKCGSDRIWLDTRCEKSGFTAPGDLICSSFCIRRSDYEYCSNQVAVATLASSIETATIGLQDTCGEQGKVIDVRCENSGLSFAWGLICTGTCLKGSF